MSGPKRITPLEIPTPQPRHIQVPQLQGLQDETVVFSFKYLDCGHPEFSYAGKDGSYFVKLIERIRDLSSWKISDLCSHKGKSVRNHEIDWNHPNISQKGFSVPGRSDVDDKAWQFQVSKSLGRVHGFVIDTIFF